MTPRPQLVPPTLPEQPPDRWFTDRQVGEHLGCSPSMVRKLRKTGALGYIAVGRLPRVSAADLQAFIQRQRGGR